MYFINYVKDKKLFEEIAPNVYGLKRNGINFSTRIYKYIDLSALIDIGNGNFKVQRRMDFSDRHESTVGMLREFYSENDDENYKKSDERNLNEILKKQSAEFLTTCFTKRSSELHAMWKAFTSGYTGVRISTTIGQIVESMKLDGYNLYIGTVKYEKVVWGYDVVRDMFTKNPCYSPEKELRIYILPKNGELPKEAVNLKVDSEKLITGITLSPFIPQPIHIPIRNMLSKRFPNANIQGSTISEKPIK